MTSVAVVVGVLVAALAAWFSARVIVRVAAGKPRGLDETDGGLRKVHLMPTPRIGGIAIAAGMVVGALLTCDSPLEWDTLCVLLACAVPGFLWGIIEDLTKRGAVAVRLALTAAAAALGYVLLDARITQLDVPWMDALLANDVFGFAFTVFAVTGVAHSINVIDGLNGLAGVVSLAAAIGLAIVAAIVGDEFVMTAAALLAASLAGFLKLNYPRGRIFLGDGGAYLVGLLLAELSVLLVHRNSEVSPWFPLMLLVYPVWETLFSMYRRKRRGRSTGEADALHLHTLVYRRVVRWRGYSALPEDYVTRNSLASLVLWAIPAVCLAVALPLWDHSPALQAAAVAFGIFYTLVYRRLVRFRVPSWLVVRAAPRLGTSQLPRTQVEATIPQRLEGRH